MGWEALSENLPSNRLDFGGPERAVLERSQEFGLQSALELNESHCPLHAPILRQLGLDSRKLEKPGRKRLEVDHGKPISEIIA
jgi:hypothetical protein